MQKQSNDVSQSQGTTGKTFVSSTLLKTFDLTTVPFDDTQSDAAELDAATVDDAISHMLKGVQPRVYLTKLSKVLVEEVWKTQAEEGFGDWLWGHFR